MSNEAPHLSIAEIDGWIEEIQKQLTEVGTHVRAHARRDALRHANITTLTAENAALRERLAALEQRVAQLTAKEVA